jgi:hypothetical protein
VTNANPSAAQPPPNQKVEEFGYIIMATKTQQLVKLTGKFTVPDLESGKDTMFMVAHRDSRIHQIYITNPTTGEVLWAMIAGLIRKQLEDSGFGPDLVSLADVPGGKGAPTIFQRPRR